MNLGLSLRVNLTPPLPSFGSPATARRQRLAGNGSPANNLTTGGGGNFPRFQSLFLAEPLLGRAIKALGSPRLAPITAARRLDRSDLCPSAARDRSLPPDLHKSRWRDAWTRPICAHHGGTTPESSRLVPIRVARRSFSLNWLKRPDFTRFPSPTPNS